MTKTLIKSLFFTINFFYNFFLFNPEYYTISDSGGGSLSNSPDAKICDCGI